MNRRAYLSLAPYYSFTEPSSVIYTSDDHRVLPALSHEERKVDTHSIAPYKIRSQLFSYWEREREH